MLQNFINVGEYIGNFKNLWFLFFLEFPGVAVDNEIYRSKTNLNLFITQ